MLPAFATYTSNWFISHTDADAITFYFAWSLATEEQFYLTWPPLLVAMFLLTRRVRGRGDDWVAGGLLLVAGVVSFFANQVESAASDPSLLLRIVASPQPAMITGALLALIAHRRRGFALLAPALATRWAPLLWLASILLLLMAYPKHALVGMVMALAVASLCMREDTTTHRLLSLRCVVHIGVVSYGMYLMHMLVLNVLERATGMDRGPLLFVALVPATVLVATIVYRYFEKPILGYKKRFEVPST